MFLSLKFANFRGYLASTYSVTLTFPKNKKANPKKNSAFTLLTTNNYLEPGQRAYVNISFEPKQQGLTKCTMVISVEHNPNNVEITLKGEGIAPILVFHEEEISFESTLPYAVNKKHFKLQNASPFPVEMYFSDFDK